MNRLEVKRRRESKELEKEVENCKEKDREDKETKLIKTEILRQKQSVTRLKIDEYRERNKEREEEKKDDERFREALIEFRRLEELSEVEKIEEDKKNIKERKRIYNP